MNRTETIIAMVFAAAAFGLFCLAALGGLGYVIYVNQNRQPAAVPAATPSNWQTPNTGSDPAVYRRPNRCNGPDCGTP